MPTVAEEFAKTRYQPKYEFMARVEGKYKGTPFVGSVGQDTIVSPLEGQIYIIHLDLPIRVDGKMVHILRCKHKEIKEMKRREKWTT